ncbi:DUF3618 domain-containing protein [Solicola gregarius]|uniref:DUF3618 domain-containing protein n=1 Tax=Solicola gregarius TaxID=2908642 RepID=A0AA46YJC3_9ACTN|nr:DUF3618 domain-containing protein [Solicola gregarius]UYM04182.1 DUF3618 domain-containing protein [Solicola gregarius]
MASKADAASPDELVAEIEETRERLAQTVDTLIDRTNPKNIARRNLESVKSQFVDANGSPRLETIVPVVGGIVGFVGLILVIRKAVG